MVVTGREMKETRAGGVIDCRDYIMNTELPCSGCVFCWLFNEVFNEVYDINSAHEK